MKKHLTLGLLLACFVIPSAIAQTLIFSLENGNTYYFNPFNFPASTNYLNNISPCTNVGSTVDHCPFTGYGYEIVLPTNLVENATNYMTLQKGGGAGVLYCGGTTYGFCVTADCNGWILAQTSAGNNDWSLWAIKLDGTSGTFWGSMNVGSLKVTGLSISNGVPFCGGGGD